MSEKFKSGFVSIIGRTNVGKSTIMNALVGEKVAVVANKVQTTRTAIRGVVNRENSQIVFIDTPGIHKPKSKLSETMVETAFTCAHDVDVILFVIDGTSKEIGRGDSKILEKIKESKRKTILIINKIAVSAIKRENIEIILDEIEKNLKYGPAYYDIEEYTDQTSRQLVEEVIREKALKFLDDEVPHGLYIETEKMKYRKTKEKQEIYDVEATIYCLRNSHKGIIIGKNGNMLKKIGTYARKDLENMLGIKVNLKIWVKVKEDWLNNDKIVKKFKLN